jgi:hypothetical protein
MTRSQVTVSSIPRCLMAMLVVLMTVGLGSISWAQESPAPTAAARGGFGGGGGGRGGGGFSAGGRGGGGASAGISQQSPPTIGQGPTCSLDATIYDVRLAPDQIGLLDVDALAKVSGSAADFEKALAALGTTKPIYRANQSVRLAFDSITIGRTEPYVTGSTTGRNGQVVNTVSYSSVGALFDLAGKAGTDGRMVVDLSIQVSTLTEGNTAISNDVKAPVFRRVTMSRKGLVEANKPFVVISIDAATPDPDGKAVAYIARVTVGSPQNPSP